MARIYVASLSDYNNGHSLGRWIDLDGLTVEDVEVHIAELLRETKYPNVMVECPNWSCKSGHVPLSSGIVAICHVCQGSGEVPSAEEWSIDAYDDLPTSFGQHPSLPTLVEYVEMAEEHGDAWRAYVENAGASYATQSDFEDRQAGSADSERDWIEQHLEDMGTLDAIPENLRSYFDAESYLRDMKLGGEVSFEEIEGTVYAFWG